MLRRASTGSISGKRSRTSSNAKGSEKPAALAGLVLFESLFGLPFAGYYENICSKAVSTLLSVSFVSALLFFSLPFCVVRCNQDTTSLFANGLSTEAIVILLNYANISYALMNDIVLFTRALKLRNFCDRAFQYSNNFGVGLLESQRNKLASTVLVLITFNLLYAVGTASILALLPYDIAPINATANSTFALPSKYANSTGNSRLPLIAINSSVLNVITIALKTIATIHSKAIETIYVYLAQYLSLLLTRLEIRYDKFIYSRKGGRSIEVAKIAFIEMQNLIQEADEIFSHTPLNVHVLNLVLLTGSAFVLKDGAWSSCPLKNYHYHAMFTLLFSFFSLTLCCSNGEDIEEEMDEVVQAISYINGESFSEIDYRSYSMLVTISQGRIVGGLSAGRFFPLNKNFVLMVFLGLLGWMLTPVNQQAIGLCK